MEQICRSQRKVCGTKIQASGNEKFVEHLPVAIHLQSHKVLGIKIIRF